LQVLLQSVQSQVALGEQALKTSVLLFEFFEAAGF
jgi:hypothetical protein